MKIFAAIAMVVLFAMPSIAQEPTPADPLQPIPMCKCDCDCDCGCQSGGDCGCGTERVKCCRRRVIEASPIVETEIVTSGNLMIPGLQRRWFFFRPIMIGTPVMVRAPFTIERTRRIVFY